MSALVQVRGVSKRFPRAQSPALDDVSFEVHDRELVTLVGASGSGKTSLLRILAGLEAPDSGEVCLDGQLLTRNGQVLRAPEQRHMGFVFQNHALFPHLKVRENVAFGLARGERSAAHIESLLELVGLGGLAGRYPHELSGGERQRIALVRALAPDPRLLLMDEPFSSLDQSLREELRDETRALIKRREATTILVTHDTADALAVSDRIVVLREGRVQQIGAPAEIYRQPANRYIASSFGPCNFLARANLGVNLGADLGADVGGNPAAATWRGIEPADHAQSEVWIRPEDLRLSRAADDAALASGVVVRSLFHGESRMVTLECRSPAGESFNVQVRQHGEFDAATGDRLGIAPAISGVPHHENSAV